MGFAEEAREIIGKMRAAGRTEQEIKQVVREASGRATVSRATDAIDSLSYAFAKLGEETKKINFENYIKYARSGITAVLGIDLANMERPNNWRKMHGLPTSRKGGKKKNG